MHLTPGRDSRKQNLSFTDVTGPVKIRCAPCAAALVRTASCPALAASPVLAMLLPPRKGVAAAATTGFIKRTPPAAAGVAEPAVEDTSAGRGPAPFAGLDAAADTTVSAGTFAAAAGVAAAGFAATTVGGGGGVSSQDHDHDP